MTQTKPKDDTITTRGPNKDPRITHIYTYQRDRDLWKAYCGKEKKKLSDENTEGYPKCVVCQEMYKSDPNKLPIGDK